jgi:hypothetical protein
MSETTQAGTPAPSPATIVCARCGGAIEPGLERCPTCGAPQSRPRVTGGSAPGLLGQVVGGIAGGLGIFLCAAWLYPDVFRLLHAGWLADWLCASAGHRMWMMLPMSVTFIIAHAVQQRRTLAATREAWTPFARASGGQVATAPRRLEAGAWTGGLQVRTGAQRWLLTLDTVPERSDESTRLRCAVTPRRDLHFALMPQNRVIQAMTSPRIGGFLLGLGRAASARDGPENEARRRALDQVSFLMGPDVELGEPEFDRAFLLKSDDEAAVRALFGDLRGMVLQLRRPGSWWQISLGAPASGGAGMLEFIESGVVRDAARLEAVQQVMIRILEYLAAAGFIAEDSPASNA